MSLGHGAKIVTNGLKICFDKDETRGFNTGNNYFNLVDGDGNTFNEASWFVGADEISITCVVEVLSTNTTYAYHPINSWGNSGTSTARIVLYHFQEYNDDSRTNKFAWYAHVNGIGWSHVGEMTSKLDTYPQTHWFGFTWNISNSVGYGQAWHNGSKLNLRQFSGSGAALTLGSGTGGISIQGVPDNNFNGIQWIKSGNFYDRKLTDEEMLQNWHVARAKYGL
jgi:hypothetical protein